VGAEKAVQYNVDTLLSVFQRVRELEGKKPVKFRTWVDVETGELRFVKEGPSKTPKGRHWQEVSASVVYRPESDQVCWEEHHLSAINFSHKALQIFHETLLAMKQLEPKVAFRIKLSDYLIINRLWHPCDRYEAEESLLTQPIGSYLFRKDRFASMLEEKLSLSHREEISLWTISVLSGEKQCSDYTVVLKQGKWQVYNDDVYLTQPMFDSLGLLLGHYKHLLRYPLYK
jgi:hypothetical protein